MLGSLWDNCTIMWSHLGTSNGHAGVILGSFYDRAAPRQEDNHESNRTTVLRVERDNNCLLNKSLSIYPKSVKVKHIIGVESIATSSNTTPLIEPDASCATKSANPIKNIK